MIAYVFEIEFSQRIKKKTFRNNSWLVDGHEVGYECEAGFETFLASLYKVLATRLRYEEDVFGTQYPRNRNSLFTLLCALCKCNHTLHSASKSWGLFLKKGVLT